MVAFRDQQAVEWLIPADIPPAYLSGIQAEVKKATTDPKTKRAVYRWTPVDANNHAFDLEYYQVAAASDGRSFKTRLKKRRLPPLPAIIVLPLRLQQSY